MFWYTGNGQFLYNCSAFLSSSGVSTDISSFPDAILMSVLPICESNSALMSEVGIFLLVHILLF